MQTKPKNVGRQNVYPKRRRLMVIAALTGGAGLTGIFSNKLFGMNFILNGYSRDFNFSYSYTGVWTHGTTIARATDGGYVMTVDGGSTSSIVKINNQGKQQWVRTLIGSDKGSSYRGKGVTAARDRGYLFIGETNSHDLIGKSWDQVEVKRTTLSYEFTPIMGLLTKIDADGNIVWKKIYGRSESHSFNSAQYALSANDGGFIVFGIKTVQLPIAPLEGSSDAIESPWIFKVNANGDVLHEIFVREAGDVFVKRTGVEDVYSKPVIDSQGNVFVAVETEEIKLTTDRSGKKKLNPDWPSGVQRYLLLKLDQEGKELSRYLFNSETVGIPVIVPADTGIDMFRINNPNISSEKRRGFVHFRFNSELKLIAQNFVADEKFRTVAAVRGVGDSFHLFGFERIPGSDRGQATLAYLNKDGILKYKKSFGRDYWPNDIVAGDNENEILVFYNTDSSDVTKVEKFTLKV